MKNSVLVLLIASLVVVGFGGCVWATEYDVKQDGGGDFTTIQAAVDAATSGDTIVVCEGDTPYYEAVDISTGGIILRAAINESPIIDAQNIRSYCITMKEYVCGNNVTVDGFICRNFTCATGQKVGGIWLRSGVNHIVKNCEIYGGPSSGSDKADISSYGGSNATIENNYLH
ncbi:MAG: hypothetical protein U9M95_00080, partial [Candidatus Altiarchaeota archaeon]|nr:hypothetical protein [Candidatus Altiarchaeota archaeon]